MISGVTSDPKYVRAGVSLSSILGPLLFLVYINDIHVVEDTESNINLITNDTCRSMVVGNPYAAGTILQNAIDKISRWADKWLVRFKTSNSENVIMYNTVIPDVNMHKHLGVFISNDRTWDNHLK